MNSTIHSLVNRWAIAITLASAAAASVVGFGAESAHATGSSASGPGIYRSLDGGRTWASQTNSQTFSFTLDLLVEQAPDGTAGPASAEATPVCDLTHTVAR